VRRRALLDLGRQSSAPSRLRVNHCRALFSVLSQFPPRPPRQSVVGAALSGLRLANARHAAGSFGLPAI